MREEERKLFYYEHIFFFFFREPYSRYSGCPSEISSRTSGEIGFASQISPGYAGLTATLNPMKGYQIMEDSKLIIERHDFNMGKSYLREILFLAVQNFQDLGGRIKICRPVYAHGCETPSSVRSMVRRGWKG